MEREGGILTNRDYNHRCPGFACDTHELGGGVRDIYLPNKNKRKHPLFWVEESGALPSVV